MTEGEPAASSIVRDRPIDHVDNEVLDAPVTMPRLGPVGWARWAWRQLTSMKTALFLLLLLAVAAVPGSLFPQRSSDPNGVLTHFKEDPELSRILDSVQAFDVYTSVWFSAIYLLLFISLIGCLIPRTRHHLKALRATPPQTPRHLSRLPAYDARDVESGDRQTRYDLIEEAERMLRRMRYRVVTYPDPADPTGVGRSVAAERGYLRETGNLAFHVALVGILAAVAIGGGFSYNGQRVVVEGQTFVNSRLAYDSFSPGRFFTEASLSPFALTLDDFAVTYEEEDPGALGVVTDYTAKVKVLEQGATTPAEGQIRVNEPLRVADTDLYLLGNGYAPVITVRNAGGDIVFSDAIPFLPQDDNLTSLGVVKVPDGLTTQLGMIGFFYPTKAVATSGAYFSTYPDLVYPVLTFNVFTGDLGLDAGAPKSVYSLDTSGMLQLTGGDTGNDSLELAPGDTVQLPEGLGSVALTEVKRFASFDVARDPTQIFVLVFAVVIMAGLLAGLLVPRRRIWVRVVDRGEGQLRVEYAGLARGDDPTLFAAVASIAQRHLARFPPRERESRT